MRLKKIHYQQKMKFIKQKKKLKKIYLFLEQQQLKIYYKNN